MKRNTKFLLAFLVFLLAATGLAFAGESKNGPGFQRWIGAQLDHHVASHAGEVPNWLTFPFIISGWVFSAFWAHAQGDPVWLGLGHDRPSCANQSALRSEPTVSSRSESPVLVWQGCCGSGAPSA